MNDAAAEATPIPQVPDAEEALRQLRADAATKSMPDEALDPKASELYTFDVRVVDAAGKVWEGAFTNRILTIPERAEVGILAARLAGNAPWDALDPDTAWLLRAQAHLTISLDAKQGGARPRWFVLAGTGAIRNVRIIEAIYREVSAHEAYFRGPSPDSPAG